MDAFPRVYGKLPLPNICRESPWIRTGVRTSSPLTARCWSRILMIFLSSPKACLPAIIPVRPSSIQNCNKCRAVLRGRSRSLFCQNGRHGSYRNPAFENHSRRHFLLAWLRWTLRSSAWLEGIPVYMLEFRPGFYALEAAFAFRGRRLRLGLSRQYDQRSRGLARPPARSLQLTLSTHRGGTVSRDDRRTAKAYQHQFRGIHLH